MSTKRKHEALSNTKTKLAKTVAKEITETKTKSESKKTGKMAVTILSGFLGAGKTTLLSHILQKKHNGSEPFKCAVIVNDMAELNIDKKFIDQKSLIQSDEVISMQNGCICCTLTDDLTKQILELAQSKKFDYMIIEGSGVSEPAHISSIFADCDEEHDHEEAHEGKTALGDVAKLDTLVTVVDSAEFFNNLDTLEKGKNDESLARLLVEQVEHANVIILNKTDVVNKDQLERVRSYVSAMNPAAKILTAKNCNIDVAEVVDTSLYSVDQFEQVPPSEKFSKEEPRPSCCIKKISDGETPCCKRSRTFDSDRSTVVLGNKKLNSKTRHSTRFDVNSFLYKARRPFHPKRFFEGFLEKYFVLVERKIDDDDEGKEEEDEIVKRIRRIVKRTKEDDDDEGEEEEEEIVKRIQSIVQRTKEEIDKEEEDSQKNPKTKEENGKKEDESQDDSNNETKEEEEKAEMEILQQQKLASEVQQIRTKEFGLLCRSKGFVWMANSNDLMGSFGQAGNIVTMETQGLWSVLRSISYKGTEKEKAMIRKNWQKPWGDRRQELVFIGVSLNHKKIQTVLDECLLTNEEFAQGLDYWKATMGDIFLDDEEEE